MTSLPSQHPQLAIHLTDRALTPVISSSASAQQLHQPQQSQPSSLSSRQQRPFSKRAAFSTSPPPSSPESASASSSCPEDDDDDAQDDPSPASSLSLLTSTALASYDTAKRLDRGAPLRTMVEYGSKPTTSRPDKTKTRDKDKSRDHGGPVVLHSYMCPMGLALGVPGRRGSHGSLTTASGAQPDADAGPGEAPDHSKEASSAGEALARQPPLEVYQGEIGSTVEAGGDAEVEAPNAPPMLISTVVAPGAEHLREARRAAGRLERLARGLQAEWVIAEGGAA